MIPVQAKHGRLSIRALPLAQVQPRLLGIYVISKTGLAAARAEEAGFSEDPTALGMMLGNVAGFVRDELQKSPSCPPAGLIRVAEGSRGFCALPHANFGLIAVLEGRETEAFLHDLKALAMRIERQAGRLLSDWDGHLDVMAPLEKDLREFLESGKYAGRADPRGHAHGVAVSADSLSLHSHLSLSSKTHG